MVGNERGVGLDRPAPVGGVDIGVAQLTGLDLDNDLSWSWLWLRHLLDAQGLIEGVDNSSSPGYFPWLDLGP